MDEQRGRPCLRLELGVPGHRGVLLLERLEARIRAEHRGQMVEDNENPEIVISVGGDGTLLQAFHQYSHMLSKVAFVGVHTGHLGFYADWLPHEVEKLIIEINNSEFQVIEYPLLEIIVRYNNNGYETRYLALLVMLSIASLYSPYGATHA